VDCWAAGVWCSRWCYCKLSHTACNQWQDGVDKD